MNQFFFCKNRKLSFVLILICFLLGIGGAIASVVCGYESSVTYKLSTSGALGSMPSNSITVTGNFSVTVSPGTSNSEAANKLGNVVYLAFLKQIGMDCSTCSSNSPCKQLAMPTFITTDVRGPSRTDQTYQVNLKTREEEFTATSESIYQISLKMKLEEVALAGGVKVEKASTTDPVVVISGAETTIESKCEKC